jgi:hypothetical protein
MHTRTRYNHFSKASKYDFNSIKKAKFKKYKKLFDSFQLKYRKDKNKTTKNFLFFILEIYL